MEKISKKIFNNEIGFEEMAPNDEEYLKREQEYCDAFDKLRDTLNAEQQKLLDDVWLCGGGVQGVMEYYYFYKGFRSGLLFGLEICADENK